MVVDLFSSRLLGCYFLDGNQHETNWTASEFFLPDCITHIYDVQSSKKVCTL
jgi:hypothetical protein